MLALYRCGRQAEALEVYRDTRRLLADELALEPGEELRRLEQQILAHAPELEPTGHYRAARGRGRRAVGRAAARDHGARRGRRSRRRLDPRRCTPLLARSWELAAAVIERHGGTVDHVADDAIVAVFGLAEAHDDDALRAVRAAADLRATVEVADLRVGVVTGRVFVAGERQATRPPDERRAAARDRRRRRRDPARRADSPARRARRPSASARAALGGSPRLRPELVPARDSDTAGGADEASCGAVLRAARARPRHEPSCRLRDAARAARDREVAAARGSCSSGSRGDATVLVGRCLAYGEGITYRPLAEIVRQVGAAALEACSVGDRRGRRIQRGDRRLAASPAGPTRRSGRPPAVRGAGRRTAAGRRDRGRALGRADAARPARPRRRALDRSADPARVPRAPGTGGDAPGVDRAAAAIARSSSSRASSEDELADVAAASRLGTRRRAGSSSVAEGNPLFLEQLVAVDSDDAEPLPDGIHAVLAARIDRLEPGGAHRALARVRRGSQLPRRRRGRAARRQRARARLVDARAQGPDPLRRRREFAGQDMFRFAHALIREAAYDGLPKRLRADAARARRHAGWQAQPDAADEIVGYHLERAYRYGAELGRTGPRTRALGARRRATARIRGAGALVRGDLPAGARLLERATALLAPDDRSRGALAARAWRRALRGRPARGRRARARRGAIAAAQAQRRPRLEARASVEQQYLRFHVSADVDVAEARRVADWAARVLAAHGDELGQCRAWRLSAWIAWTAEPGGGRRRGVGAGRGARSRRRARSASCARSSAGARRRQPSARLRFPRRSSAARRSASRCGGSPVAEAVTLRPLGLLHAMAGEFDEARRLNRAGRTRCSASSAACSRSSRYHEAEVELLAGRPAEAEAPAAAGLLVAGGDG